MKSHSFRKWIVIIVLAGFVLADIFYISSKMPPSGNMDKSQPPERSEMDWRNKRQIFEQPIVLELEIVDQQGRPLPEFPFELYYAWGSGNFDLNRKAKVDRRGKCRLVLADLRKGNRLVVWAPDKKGEKHRIADFEMNTAPNAGQTPSATRKHANSLAITPEPGKVGSLRMVFKPENDSLNPRFRMVDKLTGRPVPEFSGVMVSDRREADRFLNSDHLEKSLLEQEGDERSFHSSDRTGRLTLTALDNHPMNLVVDAPGYARQMFECPAEVLRPDREMVMELTPEARARGHVLIGETGEPLTSAFLEALLRRHGKWEELIDKSDSRLREGTRPLRIYGHLANKTDDPEGKTSHFQRAALFPLDREGWFEIGGLQPGDAWSFKVGAEGLSEYLPEHGLKLATGVNEMGDTYVGIAGTLQVKAADAQGQGVAGAWVELPVEYNTKLQTTGVTGNVSFDLKNAQCDQQLVRVYPPWGHGPKKEDPPDASIFYDALAPLDRFTDHNLTARLDPGHTLVIEIPRTPLRDEMLHFYQELADIDFKYSVFRIPGLDLNSHLGIGKVVLRGLSPGESGFSYFQRYILPDGGIRFTSGTMEVRVDHVPPGRYAVCVNYGNYWLEDPSRTKNPSEGPREWGSQTAGLHYIYNDFYPLAYAELEMRDSTTTITLEQNAADVEILLRNPPATPPPSETGKNKEYIRVFLEREQPLSTGRPDYTRSVFASIRADKSHDPTLLNIPMIGYENVFMAQPRKDPAKPWVYPSLLFRGLPPGDYRLQAYARDRQLINSPPYFETRLKVARNAGKIRMTIPYQEPKAIVNEETTIK